jgi:hypothetical protein
LAASKSHALDRHHGAAVTKSHSGIVLPILPAKCFAELVRLSRTSIADEMSEQHQRRVLGE